MWQRDKKMYLWVCALGCFSLQNLQAGQRLIFINLGYFVGIVLVLATLIINGTIFPLNTNVQTQLTLCWEKKTLNETIT